MGGAQRADERDLISGMGGAHRRDQDGAAAPVAAAGGGVANWIHGWSHALGDK